MSEFPPPWDSWQFRVSLPPYGARNIASLGFRILTRSNILTSSITDTICKNGNQWQEPEGFQLQQNPYNTDTNPSSTKLLEFKQNYSQFIWCPILALTVWEHVSWKAYQHHLSWKDNGEDNGKSSFFGKVPHILNPSTTAVRGLEFSSTSHLEFYILFGGLQGSWGWFVFKEKGIYSEQK